MNLLDRAISYVAPQRALAREKARNAIARISQVRNLYEAASNSRRTQSWRPVNTDANTEIRSAGYKLRAAARDMTRNNAFAVNLKWSIANAMVGAGIIPNIKGKRKERVAQVQVLVRKHLDTTKIDAAGRTNLYGLQLLAAAEVVEAGEVLLRKRPRRTEDGLPLPFQIEVLPAEFLDSTKQGPQPGGTYCEQGVEFNAIGKRVAYWLYDQHPGAVGRTSNVSRRVSADFVAHIYRLDRAGQVRGVTWFAPVMVRLHDLVELFDAKLLQQKIAACYTAFVIEADTTDDAGNVIPARADGRTPVETLEPGIIERLRAGEDVKFADPPVASDFGPFSETILREICAGMGVPFEIGAMNLKGVSFISGRLGLLPFHLAVDTWQWDMMIPQGLDVVAEWFRESVHVGTSSTEDFDIGWNPPLKAMVDPGAEAEADLKEVRAGFAYPSQAIRKRGNDPEEVYEGWAKDLATFDRLGLVFDSDPSQVSAAGLAQQVPSSSPTAAARRGAAGADAAAA